MHRAATRIRFGYRGDLNLNLNLREDDPVVQRAIEVKIATDPDVKNSPKNAYMLFKDLKEKWAKPLPEDLFFPTNEIAGTNVSLDLSSFQKALQEAPPIFRKDLDKLNINENTLVDLFNDFERKRQDLSLEDRQTVDNQIFDQTEARFAALKEGFKDDLFLKKTLKDFVQAGPNDLMKPDQVYLVVILNYILSQSDEIPNGSLLTERESSLFAFAASIQGCSGGKREGLAIAYRQLPITAKPDFSSLSGETEGELQGKKYIEEFIQGNLTSVLSDDNPFLHELTNIQKQSEIPQLSHQSIYLKNLLAPKIGLKHSLVFDSYTLHINNDLFEKTTEEILNCFLKYLTPKKLVEDFKQYVNQNQKNETHLYGLLSPLMQEKDLSACWELDDNNEAYYLTEKGALELLESAGYLKKS